MERRNYLKAAGGIVGATTIGGAALFATTRGASATGGASYGDVTITSDDGSVEYVAIYGASTVTWDGFETEADAFDIDIDARVVGSGAGWVDLHETGKRDISVDGDWGGSGESMEVTGGPNGDEATAGSLSSTIGVDSDGNHDPTTDWHIVGSDPDNYGLPSNSLDPALLEADSDGATKDFDVEVRSVYAWYDSGDNVIFEKEFTSTVNVTVENEETSASGSGTDTGVDGA